MSDATYLALAANWEQRMFAPQPPEVNGSPEPLSKAERKELREAHRVGPSKGDSAAERDKDRLSIGCVDVSGLDPKPKWQSTSAKLRILASVCGDQISQAEQYGYLEDADEWRGLRGAIPQLAQQGAGK